MDLCALGTTVFINAVIQRKGLVPVVVLRLCGPASQALPPFCDIRADLRTAVFGGYHLLEGKQIEYFSCHTASWQLHKLGTS